VKTALFITSHDLKNKDMINQSYIEKKLTVIMLELPTTSMPIFMVTVMPIVMVTVMPIFMVTVVPIFMSMPSSSMPMSSN
jgi:hypothetical protein